MNISTRSVPASSYPPQRGAILLLALVFLLLLAILVSSVMQASVLQLHMSGNDQFVAQAFNTAQAIVAEISVGADSFQLGTQVGQSNCPQGASSPDCVSNLLSVTTPPDMPQGIVLDYRVTRQEPLFYSGFPVRESERTASSSDSFDAALFEIDVRVDGSHGKLGSSHVVQGIAERIPSNR